MYRRSGVGLALDLYLGAEENSAMNKALMVSAAVLALSLVAVAAWIRPTFLFPVPRKQNIVIILMDTLRADHLGAYGYARETSPEIDAIARRGTVFSTVYSVSNWTNPAIKSMFTGFLPLAVTREARHKEAIRIPLPAQVHTFAELVRSAGYRTAALVDHPGINPSGGYDQGFEHYAMLYKEGAGERGAWGKSDIDYVADQFVERIDEYRNDPFLVYLHVVYPHRPYRAPSPYQGLFGPDTYAGFRRRERERLLNAYDAEIRRTDDLVGKVKQALASRNLLEDTWIILTSDHGEGFWEHGFAEHGNVFYDEAIRVPLIIGLPKGHEELAGRVDTPVSNMDIFATILEIAGIPLPKETTGLSLLRDDLRAESNAPRALFSQGAHSHDIHARAIIRGGFKYVNYPGKARSRHVLFNLREDPHERKNIFATEPRAVESLRKLLAEQMEQSLLERGSLEQRLVEPAEETLEGLRSLGYVQ